MRPLWSATTGAPGCPRGRVRDLDLDGAREDLAHDVAHRLRHGVRLGLVALVSGSRVERVLRVLPDRPTASLGIRLDAAPVLWRDTALVEVRLVSVGLLLEGVPHRLERLELLLRDLGRRPVVRVEVGEVLRLARDVLGSLSAVYDRRGVGECAQGLAEPRDRAHHGEERLGHPAGGDDEPWSEFLQRRQELGARFVGDGLERVVELLRHRLRRLHLPRVGLVHVRLGHGGLAEPVELRRHRRELGRLVAVGVVVDGLEAADGDLALLAREELAVELVRVTVGRAERVHDDLLGTAQTAVLVAELDAARRELLDPRSLREGRRERPDARRGLRGVLRATELAALLEEDGHLADVLLDGAAELGSDGRDARQLLGEVAHLDGAELPLPGDLPHDRADRAGLVRDVPELRADVASGRHDVFEVRPRGVRQLCHVAEDGAPRFEVTGNGDELLEPLERLRRVRGSRLRDAHGLRLDVPGVLQLARGPLGARLVAAVRDVRRERLALDVALHHRAGVEVDARAAREVPRNAHRAAAETHPEHAWRDVLLPE